MRSMQHHYTTEKTLNISCNIYFENSITIFKTYQQSSVMDPYNGLEFLSTDLYSWGRPCRQGQTLGRRCC